MIPWDQLSAQTSNSGSLGQYLSLRTIYSSCSRRFLINKDLVRFGFVFFVVDKVLIDPACQLALNSQTLLFQVWSLQVWLTTVAWQILTKQHRQIGSLILLCSQSFLQSQSDELLDSKPVSTPVLQPSIYFSFIHSFILDQAVPKLKWSLDFSVSVRTCVT